jgi:hypothetical protein
LLAIKRKRVERKRAVAAPAIVGGTHICNLVPKMFKC